VTEIAKKEINMAYNGDWMPGKRIKQVAMATLWVSVCGEKRVEWGIPAAALADLAAKQTEAESALDVSMSPNTRTPVTVAHCKTVCKALEDFMRDFKRRYFLCPPLTGADLLNLGLRPADPIRTPLAVPDITPVFRVRLRGPRALAIVFSRVAGGKEGSKPRGVAGARVYYLVSDVPIMDPELLAHSKWATRCPCVIRFPESDRGKRVYFALKWDAGKQDGEGPWSEIISELVP
jgi:hypothetical protein